MTTRLLEAPPPSPLPVDRVHLDLPCRLESLPTALEAIDSLAAPAGGSLREDLRLVASELVANAVLHSGAGAEERISVDLAASADGVRLEVHDPGPGFTPRLSRPAASETHGRGLLILNALVRRWGVERDQGTSVWCELAAEPGWTPA